MPPGEIPVEASDVLAFTPACLSEIDRPPVFHLRAVTSRDQRYYRRLRDEACISRHSDEEIRAVVRRELERLWSPDDFRQGIARLESYWHALDDFLIQRKDDPELTFSFSEDEQKAIDDLSERLVRASPELARMHADNRDAANTEPLLIMATVIERYEGLDTPLARAGGYMTFDCADALSVELRRIADANGIAPGALPALETMSACAKRFRLDREEEKNSVSPSPSDTGPKNSKGGDGAKTNGKSRKSARSTAKTSAA